MALVWSGVGAGLFERVWPHFRQFFPSTFSYHNLANAGRIHFAVWYFRHYGSFMAHLSAISRRKRCCHRPGSHTCFGPTGWLVAATGSLTNLLNLFTYLALHISWFRRGFTFLFNYTIDNSPQRSIDVELGHNSLQPSSTRIGNLETSDQHGSNCTRGRN